MKKEQRNRAVGFAGAIVLFSILFLLSAGGRQPAAAAQTQVMEGTGESPWISSEDFTKQKSRSSSLEKGYYSRDLDKTAKKIYKAVYKHRNSKKKFRINLPKKISMKVSRSSFRSGKLWKNKKLKALAKAISKAVNALADSNIDSYWTNGHSEWKFYYRYRWISRNKVSVRVESIKLKLKEGYKGAKKEFSTVKKTAKSIAAKIKKTRPDKTRYTTARLIYEYLIKTASYGSCKGVQYSAASVLLSKYKRTGVCSGYARAFKMICDYCGVPCLLVNSDHDDHAWNMVKLENGKWYGVDVTWGDDGNTVDYRWFMYGRNEVSSGEHPGKATFNYYYDNSKYQSGFALPKLAASTLKYEKAA